MTTIAWDGRTLAADRQATQDGLNRNTCKVGRISPLQIYALMGVPSEAMRIVEWISRSGVPEAFPNTKLGPDQIAGLVVVSGPSLTSLVRTVCLYEDSPHPVIYTDRAYAGGSGSLAAYAAMHMGAGAAKAVEIASTYDIYSGGGVDTLTFD